MKKILVLGIVAASLTGCSWFANVRDSRVVACGEQVISQNFPALVPAVKVCLAATDQASGVSCLIGLINPAIGVTRDLVACLTREEALAATKKAGAGAKAPGPIKEQEIADAFFQQQKIVFAN